MFAARSTTAPEFAPFAISDDPEYRAAYDRLQTLRQERNEAEAAWRSLHSGNGATRSALTDAAERVIAGQAVDDVVDDNVRQAEVSAAFRRFEVLTRAVMLAESRLEGLQVEASTRLLRERGVRQVMASAYRR